MADNKKQKTTDNSRKRMGRSASSAAKPKRTKSAASKGDDKTSTRKTASRSVKKQRTDSKQKTARTKRTASAKTRPAKRSDSAKTRQTKKTAAVKAAKSQVKSLVKSTSKSLAGSRKKRSSKGELKIIPIGGLNEIGKNMTAFEYNDKILIVDCGMSFPEDYMLGIDVVIPDFSYLVQNAEKVVGLVVTHGHEDHIGGIPFLLHRINCPVYGTKITLGLIENKLKEHDIKGDLRTITAGDVIKLGDFTVETIRTTHSVADAICLYIKTPAATIFHTGDFKIDYTPIDGEPIDLDKFAEIGDEGVDIMLADSTNVLRPGYTKSEKYVGEALDRIFRKANGRIIIATFSSNVHRVQKIIELAAKYNRKFSVSGRSMEKIVTLAQELGYLKIPRGSYVELDEAKNLKDDKIVIITTGSQGEPMSALARMANDEHKNVKLKKGDTVILSSTPVPGNEKAVSNVVNKLYKKGVDVIYNEIADIHVSGHACQEELKLIHSLIKPRYFMPVHGESRHLAEHAKLAESLGMSRDRIFVLDNGDELIIKDGEAKKVESAVSADDILVDGLGVGDIGNAVLRDRKMLSTSGLIVAVATISTETGELLAGPEIISRGFVYIKEHEALIEKLRETAERSILAKLDSGTKDINEIKNRVRDDLRRFIFTETQRSPIIIPVLMEV
ncbi:MAG: RNase J family beta-CASP ribonuclease [Eubacterium sp.]|jgi:ribonuclease J